MRATLTHRLAFRQGRLLYADALPRPIRATRCVMVEALWPLHEGANAIVSCEALDYLAAVAKLPPFRAVNVTLSPDGAIARLELCRPGQPRARQGVIPGEGAALARASSADPRLFGVLLDWLTDEAESVGGLPAGDVRQAVEEARRYGRWFVRTPSRPRKRRAAS